jgi:hypothetical protein
VTAKKLSSKELLMFVIKVEHWPYGREEEKSEVASLRLQDTGTGDSVFANYRYELVDSNSRDTKSGFIFNFNTDSSIWMLIKAVIGRAVSKKRGGSSSPIF